MSWGTAGCATVPEREVWKADWNARVDASSDLKQHPCGDFVFDVWADDFLAECKRPNSGMEKECGRRTEWVWERSRQCAKWQDWLLRNHNRQQRSDDAPEPETRVR
jgi:hypothetical protein